MQTDVSKRILILNQAFYPDCIAVSQYATDLAVDLVQAGFPVTVFTSRRDYNNANLFYTPRETYRGVQIERIYTSRMGKRSKWTRLFDALVFNLLLALKLLFSRRFDVVIAMTNPPLIAFHAAWLKWLKGSRFVYWIMDINPDEAIRAGMLRAGSWPARILEALSRFCFRRSDRIVALDRFQQELIESKGIGAANIVIIPPWADDQKLNPVEHAVNPFRERHGLQDKFVVMYSGNHSLIHPLDTVLNVALLLRADPQVVFLFVGGGVGVQRILEFKDRHSLQNITHLPYQPREQLSQSLSAGDLHLVTMGEPFVGIVHPCKIYGIFSVGRPFVLIGPRQSHIGDMIDEEALGFQVDHGRADRLLDVIGAAKALKDSERSNILLRSRALVHEKYSRPRLVGQFVEQIKSLLE